MLFNSALFLFFFPCVAALLYVTPPRLRWVTLLVASMLFYASWDYRYLVIIFAIAAVAYVYGHACRNLAGKPARWALASAIVLILLPLIFFKYANFILDNLAPAFSVFGTPSPGRISSLILPLGISFYTFQLLSYCLDIHTGRYTPNESFGKLLLYPMYFPHQIAGPIMRPAQLMPQFEAPPTPSYETMVSGFRLFLWGLFKKVFVADRLAVFVDAVYAAPERYRGLGCVLAFYFFAFQIYCDFSGYTDMALGASRILGIELCENFRRPYFSASLREFWTRWHISLSTWMRDYLYIPLGGNRLGPRHWAAAILAVFALSGLWHGASWTFVLWGIYHGALLVIERATQWLLRLHIPAALQSSIGRIAAIVMTFHLTGVGWVLFRAPNLPTATAMLTNLTRAGGRDITEIMSLGQLQLAAIGIAVVLGFDLLAEHGLAGVFPRVPLPLRWAIYYAAIFAVLLFPGSGEIRTFIYFQF
jgi:D-alanyl-lipoteichoic acid acyltransferase DltB (MBOAT superfamily)